MLLCDGDRIWLSLDWQSKSNMLSNLFCTCCRGNDACRTVFPHRCVFLYTWTDASPKSVIRPFTLSIVLCFHSVVKARRSRGGVDLFFTKYVTVTPFSFPCGWITSISISHFFFFPLTMDPCPYCVITWTPPIWSPVSGTCRFPLACLLFSSLVLGILHRFSCLLLLSFKQRQKCWHCHYLLQTRVLPHSILCSV